MINQIGLQPLGATHELLDVSFLVPSTTAYNWRVILFHSDGGFHADWQLGQDDCPIVKLDFELNEYLCGAGSIEFSYLDFPIHADDYVEIYYQNFLKYRAIVENSVDPKGGKVKLIPYSQRLKELLYNGSFSAKTLSEIFQTIIEAKQSDTDIVWNSTFIDTGSVDTFSPDYLGYEYPKKIFDELIEKADDRYWGIRPDNYFTIYPFSTTADYNFFQDETPVCAKVTVSKDYKNIKATRYQVFKKTSGSGESTRIGEVGYGGSYPVLDIETLVRKKEQKFTVSELILDNSEALGIAYSYLTAQTIPVSVKLADVNLEVYFPQIGDMITVQDLEEKVLRNIIDCETTTNWTGATLDTADYTEGSSSITFSGSASPTDIVYDFGKIERWYHPEKIGFMIKGTYAGDYLEASVASYRNGGYGAGTYGANEYGTGQSEANDYLWETTYIINIFTGGLWQWFEAAMTSNFRYFGIRFRSTPTAASTINIDEISLFLFHRNTYTQNVVQAKFQITEKGENVDVSLNEYDLQANDEIFAIERQLEKLEAVQQA